MMKCSVARSENSIIQLQHEAFGVSQFDKWGNVFVGRSIPARQKCSFAPKQTETYSVILQVIGNTLWNSCHEDKFIHLLKSMCGASFVIEFFAENDFNWELFINFLNKSRKAGIKYKSIVVEGRKINSEYLSTITQHKIVIRWPVRGNLYDESMINSDAKIIRIIAEHGVFIPVRLYISALHKEKLSELVDKLFSAQLYCGIELLPDFLGLTTSNHNLNSEELSSDDYCEFLSHLITSQIGCNISSYIEPVYGIADMVFNGGWSMVHNIPQKIKVVIDEDGKLKVYNKIPSTSKLWLSLQSFETDSKTDVSSDFVHFVQRNYSIPTVDNNTCCFKYICGCNDLFSRGIDHKNQRFVCEYYRFFIECFLWEKFLCVRG